MPETHMQDPDLPLENLIAKWPETGAVFRRHKMLCVGCLVAPFHSVADACLEYGISENAFYKELAAALAA